MADIHRNLVVSAAPHVNAYQNTASIMRDVCIALIPAVGFAIYMYGLQALILTLVCIAGCVFAEWLTRKILGKSNTVGDWSAIVTGLILALNLPVNFPYWMALIGCIIAIVVTKQIFGGLGQNFANPAIVARVALLVGFSGEMTQWRITDKMSSAIINYAGADAVTGATPLGIWAKNAAASSDLIELPTMWEMFLGKINGSMGEISALALIIGGVYLVIRKVISPAIPLSFIGSVAVMALILGENPLFHILAGGVMLGAIFMATDYVTSPITCMGKIIFGIGCGVLTMLIRCYGAYPEGVSFAILFMNILVPHIDNLTKHVAFGMNKGGKK